MLFKQTPLCLGSRHSHTFLVNEWSSTACLEAIWYYISKNLKMPFAPSKTILANFSKRTYMNVNKDLPTGLFISFIYDSPNLNTTNQKHVHKRGLVRLILVYHTMEY